MCKKIQLTLLTLFFVCKVVAQSNECATAVTVPVTATCVSPVSGTTVSGFSETFIGCSGNADDDGWYQFTATGTSHQITVASALGDMVIEVYSGACASLVSLVCRDAGLAGDDEVATVTGLTIGTVYRFRVFNYVTGGAAFTVCVTLPPAAPGNNECSGATLLAVNTACVATPGTTNGATQSATIACAGTSDDDVWYKFVATNALQNVSVNGTGIDAVLQVFSGTCASLTSLSCTDVTFSAGVEATDVLGLTPGTTYFFRVYDYYYQSPGAFSVCVTGAASAVPTNDDPCGAIQLAPVTAECTYQSFNSTGATATTAANVPAPSACGGTTPFIGGWLATGPVASRSKDIWFKVTVPNTGNLTITSQPTALNIPDYVMSAYTVGGLGLCTSAFSQIACNDDYAAYPGPTYDGLPYLNLTGLTPGETIYIRCWGYANAVGPISFCVTTQTNDLCANALDICDLNGFSGTTSPAYTADRPGNMRANAETAVTYAYVNGVNSGGIFGSAGPWGTGSSSFSVKIDNNSWIKFVASATTAVLNVAINNCYVGNYPSGGIQMQIFSGTNCSGFTPVSNFEESSSAFSISANSLTIGNTYYLMIDGFAGDVCSYTITAQSGVQFPDIPTPAPICAGASVTLTAPPVPVGGSWEWQHNNATTQSVVVNPATTSTYYCLVTGICGKKQLLDVVVTVLPSPLITITPASAVICAGDAVTVTATGASTYLWSTGATTAAISPTPAATTTYTVTGTTAGCTGSKSVVITRNALPSGSSSGAVTICQGASTTLTSGAAFGDVATWSPGGVSTNLTVTPAATTTYNLTVTNLITGCSRTASIVVTVTPRPATPTISAGGPTTFCPGGSVVLTASAGTSYLWSTGASTQSITVSAAGSYTVQTINASLCSSLASAATTVTVSPTPATPTISASGSTTLCPSGSVVLTSSAASSYLWSTGAITQSITVSSSGSYTVVTSSAAGCPSVASAATVVTVNPTPATPTISASGPTTFCPGGSVVLTSSAASGYSWSNGANTQSITVSLAGSYTVVTSSAAGCPSAASAATTVTISPAPATPTISASGPTTFCPGGSVVLTSTGATSYLWSNGATTQSITVSASGSYTVVTSSGAGCPSAASAATVVTVNPTPATPTISASGPITFCPGGSVVLTSSGASSYLWSNGANTQSITVSTSGSFTVVTSSAASCPSAASAATSVTVNPTPATPTISASGPTIFCPGGSVVLTSSGASSYLWSTGATTQSITVTSSGSYTVVTSSAANCPSAASAATVVTVNPTPATPTISASGPTTFCPGGSVVLTSSGASSYLWSNGANTQSITVAISGAFTVVTSSAASCPSAASAATSVTVSPTPATPTISASGPTTFCPGGSVILTSTGASSYLWSTGATTQSITVTSSGSYTVVTSSAANCPSAASAATVVTVNPTPATPTISASGPTTFCPGGSVVLTSTGASSYLWSNGATTQSITVTTSGSYSVVTSSAANCPSAASAATTVTVNPTPATPTISASPSTTICSGNSVTLTASAGSSYSWSTGESTASIVVTTTGTYTVQTTSAATCPSLVSAGTTITVSTTPVISITQGAAANACLGTAFNLNATSSIAGTSFVWNAAAGNATTAATSVTIPSGATTYSVTGTVNGCSATQNIIVTALNLPTANAGIDVTRCSGTAATVLNSTGSSAGNYVWTPGGPFPSILVSPTVTTTYSLEVTNTTTGCKNTDVVTVNVVAPPIVSITEGAAVNVCAGAPVTLTGNGATTYSWSNGDATAATTFTPSASGTYTVTGTSGSCTDTESINVNYVVLPTATASTTTPTICNGSTATLSTTGSSAGTYSWSGGSASVSPVATTTYTLTVTDAIGCQQTSPVTVTVTPNPVVSITEGLALAICSGNTQALTATGATSYSWSSGQTSSAISITPSATTVYTVTGTTNGCSDTESATITVATTPTVSITQAPAATVCLGLPISLNATSSNVATTYVWSSGGTSATESVTPAAGTTSYTVTGTANGCPATATVSVSTLALPIANAGLDVTRCVTSGPTILNSTGSSAGTYLWSEGSVTPSIAVSPVGPLTTYTLTVTNAQGCLATDDVVVSTVAALVVSITEGTSINVCAGSPITLTGSGATTYSWSSGESTPSITVTPTSSGTYTLTGNAGVCIDTETVTVTMNSLPTLQTAPASVASNCLTPTGELNAVAINGAPAITYSWTNSTSVVVGTAQNLTAVPAGSYSLAVVDGNGCAQSFGPFSVVNANAPSAPVITTSDATNCIGASTTMVASVTNPTATYAWTGPLAFTSAVATVTLTSVVPTNAGNYCVTATVAGCESVPACENIQILSPPTIQALTLDGDTTICSNSSFTMTASGGATYSWSGPNAFSAPGQTATFNVNATNAGTYTVTGTDANGCVNTKSIIISELPLPTLTATADQIVYCLDGTGNLSASGAVSYTWTGPNAFTSSSQNLMISPLTANEEGQYIVTGTDAEGCKNTDTLLLDIVTDFIVSANASATAVCPGSPFTINATGGGLYSWIGPNNFSTTNASTTFNSSEEINSGTYVVTVTNAQGCTAKDSVDVSVGTGGDCLEIPTLVTPNEDGHNDAWVIKGIENFKNAEISIFNRWGTEIYRTSSYTNDWSGQINNGSKIKELDQKDGRVPVGTYFFILDLNMEGMTPVKGYLELQY
jgi:large repetitive protein